ncbi:MAG: TIM barrel protein [Armatimonadota bacterium]|jgi:sugar phosphate isomerase/epimerase
MGSAVSAGSSSGWASGDDSRPDRVILGLVTYILAKEWDVPTIIEHCAATGFEAAELRTTHAHRVEVTLTPEERKQVKAQFGDSPVKLVSLGTACEYDSPDADELAKQMQESREFIDLAADLGCVGIKVRPNHLHEDKGIAVDTTLQQIGDSLRELGEYGEPKKIQLWLEVHGRGTSHVPHCKTIMEAANHPMVGLTWNCNKGDIVDGSVRENWMLVRKWVRCLHIHDLWDEDAYPWTELFQLIKETGWKGYALWERGGQSDDPRALMSKQKATFDELCKLLK